MAKKFEFKELSLEDSVNHSGFTETPEDKIVNEAVSEHLKKIFDENNKENENNNDTEQNNSNAVKIDLSKDQNIFNGYDQGYKKGLEDGKSELEDKMKSLSLDFSFLEKMKNLIDSIDDKKDFTKEYLDSVLEIITLLVDKLKIHFSPDFTKILNDQLKLIFDKVYKSEEVTIFVSSTRVEYCKKIMKENGLGEKIDKINIEIDSNLSDNDIRIEHKNTRMEYNFEEISKDIDKIVEIFKNESKISEK